MNLRRFARRVFALGGEPLADQGGEKSQHYYDSAFDSVESFARHYTESPYYFLWTVIIDRIRKLKVESILEIACGTGQLAEAISEAIPGTRYRGFDFSEVGIAKARAHAPHLNFDVADARSTSLYSTVAYDLVVSTEFLEHIETDIEVLQRIRAGAHFIGTVPNFPYVSHVRHFENVDQVRERYAPLFDDFSVCPIVANKLDKKFYLLQGALRES